MLTKGKQKNINIIKITYLEIKNRRIKMKKV